MKLGLYRHDREIQIYLVSICDIEINIYFPDV
jgi:hypothetical protein